jgi:hypothetical protein
MAAAYFYVTDVARDNGDHEVHESGCKYMPAERNRTPLGYFTTCQGAVQEAGKHHRQVNGCAWCSPACHTT